MVHGEVRRGGSVALVELIDRHGEAIEWDLRQTGVDVRDVFRPGGGASKLTPRQVLSFVSRLGPGSVLYAEVNGLGVEGVGWDRPLEALTAILDELRLNTVLSIAPYLPKGKKLPTPTPTERPGEKAARPAPRTVRASELPGAVPLGR